jgi:hypothetical protein
MREWSNAEKQPTGRSPEDCVKMGRLQRSIILCETYFAIAVGFGMGIGQVVGWSGPLPSPETAANEAIAKCKERGGTNPHIKAQWHDYYHSFEKRV